MATQDTISVSEEQQKELCAVLEEFGNKVVVEIASGDSIKLLDVAGFKVRIGRIDGPQASIVVETDTGHLVVIGTFHFERLGPNTVAKIQIETIYQAHLIDVLCSDIKRFLQEREAAPLDWTQESADKRPHTGSNINDHLDKLEVFLNALPQSIVNEHSPAGFKIEHLVDAIRWYINRWSAMESGLLPIATRVNTPDLKKLLKSRCDVLYWLLNERNTHVTNEEIIALCKGSLNPKFTNTLQFEVPPGYKGGNPLRLMEEAMKSIKVYERNYGPYVPEPDYLIAVVPETGIIRRFINPEWIDWWGAYTDRTQNPRQVATDRMYEHFKDRPDLKQLDIRVRDVAEPKVVDDERVQYEVFVTYQASI